MSIQILLLILLAVANTAVDWLDAAKREATLVISSITEMELLIGSRDKKHLKEILQFLSRFKIVSINEQISN